MGCIPGVSGNFHSRPFAGMKTSDSRSRIMGMYFFYPLPVAEFWKYFLSFPSCSRILGMGFFHSLPVPKLREWNYPFPFLFLNAQKSFPLTPAAYAIFYAKEHVSFDSYRLPTFYS